MEIIQKGLIGLKDAQYYITHLSIINPFMPVELTPKEREVLGTFMSFKGTMAENNRFGTSFRKEVKRELGLSDGGLTNHITNLKIKGAIKENLSGLIEVAQFLVPEEKKQFYQFKIVQE